MSKKYSMIRLFAMVTLLIVAFYYLPYEKVPAAGVEIATAQFDPTAVYKNNNYGFQFSYPSNGSVSIIAPETNSPGIAIEVPVDGRSEYVWMYLPTEKDPTANPKVTSLHDYKKNYISKSGEVTILSQDEFANNDIHFLKQDISIANTNFETRYVISKGNKIFILKMKTVENNEQYKKALDAIAQSFSFI